MHVSESDGYKEAKSASTGSMVGCSNPLWPGGLTSTRTRPCQRRNAEVEEDQETAGAAGLYQLLLSTSFGSSNSHPPGPRRETLPLFSQLYFKSLLHATLICPHVSWSYRRVTS